jgi:hypothetical protein
MNIQDRGFKFRTSFKPRYAPYLLKGYTPQTPKILRIFKSKKQDQKMVNQWDGVSFKKGVSPSSEGFFIK